MPIHCCYSKDSVKAVCSALQLTTLIYIKLLKDIINPTSVQDIPNHDHCY